MIFLQLILSALTGLSMLSNFLHQLNLGVPRVFPLSLGQHSSLDIIPVIRPFSFDYSLDLFPAGGANDLHVHGPLLNVSISVSVSSNPLSSSISSVKSIVITKDVIVYVDTEAPSTPLEDLVPFEDFNPNPTAVEDFWFPPVVKDLARLLPHPSKDLVIYSAPLPPAIFVRGPTGLAVYQPPRAECQAPAQVDVPGAGTPRTPTEDCEVEKHYFGGQAESTFVPLEHVSHYTTDVAAVSAYILARWIHSQRRKRARRSAESGRRYMGSFCQKIPIFQDYIIYSEALLFLSDVDHQGAPANAAVSDSATLDKAAKEKQRYRARRCRKRRAQRQEQEHLEFLREYERGFWLAVFGRLPADGDIGVPGQVVGETDGDGGRFKHLRIVSSYATTVLLDRSDTPSFPGSVPKQPSIWFFDLK
ncbi:hypothetical protein GLOTRDRAFT_93514 [Gloeophyllum trabeum ATCC 11539]|uniref:Uncharacterized protein n=1 Tax=Gloeophyllum trabeum (strain ATCC 11539 / FP-39264 / Madison 617) TaxID=670483 RepID=S7Q946_GLOTA|nr:uncharacterized protein GLOTRDRAFT_93514 [Gloeophyllum trabeum ATCC 11539]EPQ56017.1 hypothetical protein GLOTRDRAFT_93514 [Gloeophyllum trabeum ATCC 11539]